MTPRSLLIRAYETSDVDKVKEIWEKYYSTEFDFPDFFRNFHCAFGIEDAEGNLISAGGIRPIAELIAITDKKFSTRIRREALYKLLGGSLFVARAHGYDTIHSFIQDERWEKVMLAREFRPTKGRSLVIDVE